MTGRVYDHIVLGCGISGITVAYELSREGAETLVLDSYDGPGGNHMSIDINGYSFDSGSIFFWDDNPQFVMFPGLLERCVPVDYALNKLRPDGRVSNYPFSLEEFFSYGLLSLPRIFTSLLISKWRSRKIRTAKEFMEYYVGRYFNIISGLENYVRRFYNLDPALIGSDFASARMGWIRDNGSFRRAPRNVWLRLFPSRQREHTQAQTVVRPRAGFADYYGFMTDALGASGVRFQFGRELQSIKRVGDIFEVRAGDQSFLAHHITSTIPVDIVLKLAGLRAFPGLNSSRLITLCCSFVGKCKSSSIVLYNFDKQGVWKRLTVHSNSYGEVRGAQYMSIECLCTPELFDVNQLFSDFVSHVNSRKIFQGEINLEYAFELDYSYPIYTVTSQKERELALSTLREFGINSVGRQGGFKYIPHSTLIIDSIRRWRRTLA